jgi:hypothetical protein
MEYNEFADHWVMTMEGYKIDICFSVCFFKILFPTMYMTCYCICVLLVPLEWCHTLHFFLSCFPYNNMGNSIYLQFKTFYHKNYDFVPTKITTFLLIYYNHLFLPLVNLELLPTCSTRVQDVLHTNSGYVAHVFTSSCCSIVVFCGPFYVFVLFLSVDRFTVTHGYPFWYQTCLVSSMGFFCESKVLHVSVSFFLNIWLHCQ